MNFYYISCALNLSSLYMLAGSGACFSLKSGELNIGGEGQIYAGGFLCAVCLNALKNFHPIIAISLAIFSSIIFSGLMVLLCAFLKKIKNVSILLTSYIISAAIIPLIDGLIAGHFRGESANLLSTQYIQQDFRFSSILPPGPLNVSLFAAIAVCTVCGFIIFKTSYGKQLAIFGISNEFAKFSNFDLTKLSFSSSFISGAFHGLCGAIAVCGTYFTCHQGFYISMGWNALTCALLAQGNPFFLLGTSVLMGFVTTYADRFALYHNFSFDMSSLLQAIFLLIISFPIFNLEKKK